jgi:pimeloyl-ACP methyl ester carboxylesterase
MLVVALVFPASSVASDGCADLQVIGIRGSGQPAGYGAQVGPVVEAVERVASATGRSVDSVALEYPALSLADSFGLALFTGEYDASVRAGADALVAEIGDIATACPGTRFVLVGYSQGAQVIKAALADAPPTERIGGVVLLADPTRDPDQRGIIRLGDPTAERAGAFGAVPLPDHLRSVAVDVCAAGDGVCERGRRDLLAHTEGYADAPAAVVPWLVAELDDAITGSRFR